MTWVTRLKLAFGTMGVMLIVGALTFVYTERESSATSQTAAIAATVLPVGTDYGGKVVEQLVEEGAYVTEGEPLFTIDSLERQRHLEMEAEADALTTAATSTSSSSEAAGAQERDDDEEFSPLWTVTASASGTIADVPTGVGGYVPAGGIVAHVFEEGSLYISTDFVLTPRDFDRLHIGAPVEIRLPDRTTATGSVEQIEVATEDGAARAFVRVDSDEITRSDPVGLTAPGTPVTAAVDLRDDGPLAGLRDTATDFLKKIGL